MDRWERLAREADAFNMVLAKELLVARAELERAERFIKQLGVEHRIELLTVGLIHLGGGADYADDEHDLKWGDK